MALDGIVISNIVNDLREKLVNGRIMKISQPEKDELILTIKNYSQYKLFMSAGAGLPLIYLTEEKKEAPLNAPNFCMLLRKHLSGARIVDIYQPDFERIVNIKLEHLDELGDLCTKLLIIEIMGKHSNIIFCDSDMRIIDSIKHVSGMVSSVREVLPRREYFITRTEEKYNPLEIDCGTFCDTVLKKPLAIGKALYMTLTGFSPLAANELCCRAGIDPETAVSALSTDMGIHLHRCFERFMEDIKEKNYIPNIVYRENEPVEFSSVRLTCYENAPDIRTKEYESISSVLAGYYSMKEKVTRIRQKSADLRRIVGNAYERSLKKHSLQLKQLEDTEKREKYRLYGELLTTYGYSAQEGAKSVTVNNYYSGEDITIPLDPEKTAIENAKSYFERYSKQKRTYEAVSRFIEETKEELEHLDSIRTALDIALKEEDLVELREELIEYGYMKRHSKSERTGGRGKNSKSVKVKVTSRPFHYVSQDGFHIYVGKNNYQNDELTFKFAAGNDWWFHAKGIAGSHVIVRTEGRELTDRTYEEAAALAAYYSKGRDNDKVEIDYLEKRNVKKPNGAKPGFVVYYTNYSMMASPGTDGLTQIN